MHSQVRQLFQMEEFKELVLVILFIGFVLNVAASAVFSLFQSEKIFYGQPIEIWIIILCGVLIFLISLIFLYSKARKRRITEKEKKEKEKSAIDYLISLTFDYLLRFLFNLQEDTKDLSESDIKNKLQEPIMYTSSMIMQKRPDGPFDLAITYNLVRKWNIIASDRFNEIINEIVEKVPSERWNDYGQTLNQMVTELDKIIDIFEPYLPMKVIVILPDLKAASNSFYRCASVMPILYQRLYPESKDSFFFQTSAYWLHSAFKSISRLADYLWEDIIEAARMRKDSSDSGHRS